MISPTVCARSAVGCCATRVPLGEECMDAAADLVGSLIPVESQHLAAIVDPEKIGRLLRSIEGYCGDPITRLALKLVPYIFPRPIVACHHCAMSKATCPPESTKVVSEAISTIPAFLPSQGLCSNVANAAATSMRALPECIHRYR